MIDVPHDSGFLVIDIPNRVSFLLSQLTSKFLVFSAEALVLSAVAKELGLSVGGDDAYRRTKDT